VREVIRYDTCTGCGERILPWAMAGGPDECEHGWAAGLHCPRCCEAARSLAPLPAPVPRNCWTCQHANSDADVCSAGRPAGQPLDVSLWIVQTHRGNECPRAADGCPGYVARSAPLPTSPPATPPAEVPDPGTDERRVGGDAPPPPILMPRVTRVVVVDRDGLAFEQRAGFDGLQVHIQDDGRTLKVFPLNSFPPLASPPPSSTHARSPAAPTSGGGQRAALEEWLAALRPAAREQLSDHDVAALLALGEGE
jgi:hypothetical protein